MPVTAQQTQLAHSIDTHVRHVLAQDGGDEAKARLGSYAAKGSTAVKMRVVGRDGFSIAQCVRRVQAAPPWIASSVYPGSSA